MKKRIFYFITVCLVTKASFSQFIVRDVYFETTGVSNQGEVVGYVDWAGPYSIWTPETNTSIVINGTAPGNGVGGRATFSNDGNFLSGTNLNNGITEMALYNKTSGNWTNLGSLGFTIDNNSSNGFTISGDGTVVAGNAWTDTTGGFAFTHAIAWNTTDGVIDLGSMFFGKSTRANATNLDGSVIVGWQDFNGPWKSAVWRKNPNGAYFSNEYILLDPNGSATDEFNQMGECSAVSSDGKWIGGVGDFANNNHAWIWSQETGVIDLGTINGNLGQGYVAAINQDGTVAVGRIKGGMWEADIPFIWTPTGGMQELNEYAMNTLGFDLGTKQIYAANCMSANGDYIAGYGMDTVSFEFFAYRLSAIDLGLKEIVEETIQIVPNPSNKNIHIKNSGKSNFVVKNNEGRELFKSTVTGDLNLDISDFGAGIYYVEITNDKMNRIGKFVKI